MDERGFPYLGAAILSAAGAFVSAVTSFAVGAFSPGSIEGILELVTAAMAGGFLYLVRKWMEEREAADRRLMDTFREHSETQRAFESQVTHFMGLVSGKLGLYDSDPKMRAGEPKEQARE